MVFIIMICGGYFCPRVSIFFCVMGTYSPCNGILIGSIASSSCVQGRTGASEPVKRKVTG